MLINHAWTRGRALIALLVVALIGALVLAGATDAFAKRKKPKKNISLAAFAGDYEHPRKFSCSYLEKVDRIVVEDWVCSAGPGGTAILFSQLLTRGGNSGYWWEDEGWKYLAAPKRFSCEVLPDDAARTIENYRCAYKERGTTYKVPLKNTNLATSDQGEKWYLQRIDYPPSPTPTP
ncbi:hypothetical protein [Streptomyces shaanxiensis]|uniref:Uncharacterized protein n=1 Tax=Streptomyces shaanxiensis TaxID=653357 RepID=A0ABP7U9P5_9ACTN